MVLGPRCGPVRLEVWFLSQKVAIGLGPEVMELSCSLVFKLYSVAGGSVRAVCKISTNARLRSAPLTGEEVSSTKRSKASIEGKKLR